MISLPDSVMGTFEVNVLQIRDDPVVKRLAIDPTVQRDVHCEVKKNEIGGLITWVPVPKRAEMAGFQA